MGYEVTSVDGIPEMAAWASAYTGHPVAVKLFHEIDYRTEFDGVWASASLLHCHRDQLPDVIRKVMESLKDNAVAYMSFKWGETSTLDDSGRYFTNQTSQSLKQLLVNVASSEILGIWDSEVVLCGHPQKWVYAIIRKCGEQG